MQRCLPKMGSFPWKYVEYKEQIGFILAFFALAGTTIQKPPGPH